MPTLDDVVSKLVEKRARQFRRHGWKYTPEVPDRERAAAEMTPDMVAAITAELGEAGIAATPKRDDLVAIEAGIAAHAVAGPRIGPFLLKWNNEVEAARLRIAVRLARTGG